jgi:hypothetical protein
VEYVVLVGEIRNARKLVGISEGKRPLGRLSSRWKDNVRKILNIEDGRIWTG